MENRRAPMLLCILYSLCLATLVASQGCDRAHCYGRGECTVDTWTGTYLCTCDPGTPFSGTRCDLHACPDTAENKEWTCYNGGYCNEIVQGEVYNCTCLRSFTGNYCEKEGTDCANGGLCFYGECNEALGTCECTSGWEGPNCERAKNAVQSGFFYRSSGGGTPWYTVFFSVVGAIGAVVVVVGGYVYYIRQRNLNRTLGRFHELKQLDSHWDASGD